MKEGRKWSKQSNPLNTLAHQGVWRVFQDEEVAMQVGLMKATCEQDQVKPYTLLWSSGTETRHQLTGKALRAQNRVLKEVTLCFLLLMYKWLKKKKKAMMYKKTGNGGVGDRGRKAQSREQNYLWSMLHVFSDS